MRPFCFIFTVIVITITINNVKAQSTLFARNSGDWNDNSTWSIVSAGGVSCTCTPTNVDSVVIDGFNVALTANADANDLFIASGSSLDFDNSIGLTLHNGSEVQLEIGSTISHSGSASNANITFDAGTSSLNLENGAIFNLDDIFIQSNVILELVGGGDLTLTDDFNIVGSNILITNNLSGSFNLTGPGLSSLWFKNTALNATVINNGTINCDRYIYVQAPSTTITNNGTINCTNASYGITLTTGDATGTVITNSSTGVINVAGAFNVSNNQMTFNNSGTLDLDGNLTSWSNTAPSEFHNLSGGILRFAGTGQFYGDFYANYDSNDVIFDNASSLQNELIDPEDNYWNLTFSGFQKQIKSNILCKGDFDIQTNTYITANRSIIMNNGGGLNITSGGSLTRSSGTGSVAFDGNSDFNFTVNDVSSGFAWDFIYLGDSARVNINGVGKITIDNDIVFTGDSSVITNDLTGVLSILNSVYCTAGSNNNSFINNDTISVSATLGLAGSSNNFTNNGQLNLGTDLLFTGGNLCAVNNSGEVNIADDLFFNASTGSKLTNTGLLNIYGAGNGNGLFFGGQTDTICNSGTLTNLGQIKPQANTNDDNVFINLAGGSVTVESDFQLVDADFILDNYGTFTLNGRFDDFGGNESINNRTGGVFNYAGVHNAALNSEISLFTDFDSNTFNYSRSDGTAQSLLTPQSTYWNLSLSGTGTKLALVDLDVNGALSISGTADFDVNTNNVDMTIAGDWSNSSSFDQGTQQVTFDGEGDQLFSESSGDTFYDLIVNKSSGKLLLNDSLTVINNLQLDNGDVDLNGNKLIISSGIPTALSRTVGTIISESTDVSGKLVWDIGASIGTYSFPFSSSGGDYIPVVFQLTAGDAGEVSIATYSTAADNLPLPPGVANLEGLPSVSNEDNTIDRFWQIDKSGPSGTVNVTFSYAQSEVSADIIGLESELVAQRYNSGDGNWDEPISDQVVDGASNTVFVSGITQFSPWTLVKSSLILPIELLTFEAKCNNENILINWSTLKETNNDRFVLQKSKDLEGWIDFAEVFGYGSNTWNETIQYEYRLDQLEYDGFAYYRLKQIDLDGEEELFDVSHCECKTLQSPFSIAPNPNNGSFIIGLKEMKASQILILDVLGNIVLDLQDDLSDVVDLSLSLKPGIYDVHVLSQDIHEHQSMVIQ